jgi:hypothetical protein
MDKAMEKYDTSYTKWLAFARSKDPAILVEQYHSFIETRKQYLGLCFDFILKATSVLRLVVPFVNDVMVPVMLDSIAVTDEISWILNGLMTMTKNFGINWSKDEEEYYSNESVLENHHAWKDEFLSSYTGDVTYIKSSIANAGLVNPAVVKDKEGYLSKLIDKKWVKNYYFLINDTFSTIPVTTEGANTILNIPVLNILLCSVKVNKTEDRKFCFEIINTKKYICFLIVEIYTYCRPRVTKR